MWPKILYIIKFALKPVYQHTSSQDQRAPPVTGNAVEIFTAGAQREKPVFSPLQVWIKFMFLVSCDHVLFSATIAWLAYGIGKLDDCLSWGAFNQEAFFFSFLSFFVAYLLVFPRLHAQFLFNSTCCREFLSQLWMLYSLYVPSFHLVVSFYLLGLICGCAFFNSWTVYLWEYKNYKTGREC